jgi:hypothetical protein
VLTNINSKPTRLKIGIQLCLAVAALEFVFLKVNSWAFLVLALSPLPIFLAVRQARAQNPLFLLTILMLAISSVFLFVDQNNHPVVMSGPAGFVSTLCGAVIWIAGEGLRNVEGARLSNDADSVGGADRRDPDGYRATLSWLRTR